MIEHSHGVVEGNKKPMEGQSFESIFKAYEFYNGYARTVGFSIRIQSRKKCRKTGEANWKLFVCNKQGTSHVSHEIQQERNRGITRTGCLAQFSIVRRKGGTNWILSKFIEEHNHELATPGKVHLLKSQRKVSSAKKVLLKHLDQANVPTCQQARILEIQAGGIANVGCTERDLRNHHRDLREEAKGYDAETLFEYFSAEKEKNPSFHFVFDKDDEDRMTRCYWTDAKSIRAYNFFGDVVIFDTTYNTNKYSMIFAPLMGVNHHGQTIIFGSAFLSDETSESFVWLFSQWLDSMFEGPPKIIVTDQDPAMTKAIAERLPNTFHRYCIWHIMDKFSLKLGPSKYQDYYHYFRDSVYGSDTKEYFEASWENALEKSGLQEHGWLRSLYGIRASWVPAYINHIFYAGIQSSQRAESGHSFFKDYVKKNNSLIDFITRFNRALGKQRELERISDWIDINEKSKLKSAFPMEQHMAQVYTTKIFKKFQKQVFESNAYMVHRVGEDETSYSYIVKRVGPDVSKERQLVHEKASDFEEED